jgi:hypothetical protein
MIIDNGTCTNVVSTTLFKKLNLITINHVTLYILEWLNEYKEVMVTKMVLSQYKVGRYKDEVLSDVISMHATHLLLGKP